MAAGLGGGGGGTTTASAGRAGAMGASICTGSDSAEKMFRPVPAYSTCSLSARDSVCMVTSILELLTFCATAHLAFCRPIAGCIPAARPEVVNDARCAVALSTGEARRAVLEGPEKVL